MRGGPRGCFWARSERAYGDQSWIPDAPPAPQIKLGPRGGGALRQLDSLHGAHPGLERVATLKPQNLETHFSSTIALKFWPQSQTPSRLEQQVHFLKKEKHFVVREKMPAQEAPAAERVCAPPRWAERKQRAALPKALGWSWLPLGTGLALVQVSPSSRVVQCQAHTADLTGTSKVTRRPPQCPLDMSLCCHRGLGSAEGLSPCDRT